MSLNFFSHHKCFFFYLNFFDDFRAVFLDFLYQHVCYPFISGTQCATSIFYFYLFFIDFELEIEKKNVEKSFHPRHWLAGVRGIASDVWKLVVEALDGYDESLRYPVNTNSRARRTTLYGSIRRRCCARVSVGASKSSGTYFASGGLSDWEPSRGKCPVRFRLRAFKLPELLRRFLTSHTRDKILPLHEFLLSHGNGQYTVESFFELFCIPSNRIRSKSSCWPCGGDSRHTIRWITHSVVSICLPLSQKIPSFCRPRQLPVQGEDRTARTRLASSRVSLPKLVIPKPAAVSESDLAHPVSHILAYRFHYNQDKKKSPRAKLRIFAYRGSKIRDILWNQRVELEEPFHLSILKKYTYLRHRLHSIHGIEW